MENSKRNRKLLFISALLLIFNFSYSQKINKNIESYSLELSNGISLPIGDLKDYSTSGFNSNFVLNKNFCNNISIGLDANYSSLPIKNEFGISNEKWNSTSISVGPQYNLNFNKFFIQFYGRLGVSFIGIPEIKNYYPKTDVILLTFEKANTTGLNTRFGINFGIEICNNLSFYLTSQYTSNINSEINYGVRNLSSAITSTGAIDPDLASEIAFNKDDLSFSSLNLNFGIRIDFGNNSGTKATDYNSSRSNRTTSSILDKGDENDDGNSSGTKATDYNSSRSNKSLSAIDINNEDDGGNNSGTKATDYNSSRSNKSLSAIDIDNDDDDSNNNGTRTIINQKEEKIALNGKLLGMFLVSRKFEFKKDNGDFITGTINSKIPDRQLIEYSQQYLNHTCRIHVLIRKINLNSGKEELRYEILEILEY